MQVFDFKHKYVSDDCGAKIRNFRRIHLLLARFYAQRGCKDDPKGAFRGIKNVAKAQKIVFLQNKRQKLWLMSEIIVS
jgi:hypothetical protein